MKTATYQIRIKSGACENFGGVDYTITETLTETPTGLDVVIVTRGVCEGERIDERHAKPWLGITLAAAGAYRLRAGYTKIA